MMKNTKLMILFLVLCLSLSGCWDRWELNELSLIVGMAIDKDEDEYILTMQAMNPAEIASQETGRGYAQAMNVQERSKTIHESLRRMVQKSPRRSFISQLKVLVISEDVAKDGLEHVLDFFYRDHESRSDFYIVVSQGERAHDVLDIITPLETLPSQNIFDSISFSLRSYGGTKAMTLDELYQEMMAEGIEPSIMGIKVSGDLEKGKTKANAEVNSPAAMLRIDEIALFKQNKLIGWLNSTDSKGLDYLTQDVSDSVGSFTCPGGGEIAIEVRDVHRELQTEIIHDVPKATYKFEVDGTISEVDCESLDLALPSSYQKVEEFASEEFTKTLYSTIDKTKELKTDVLGIGQDVYRNHPDYWEANRDQWDTLYPQVDVEIDINLHITDSGSIINSFLKKGDT
ncbi:Ger(x)C family spore germination protein [Shouchella sp. JSM 1781072]|uniref:Ger(x)C family spore germination protein n=1 Tax=Bacillaceae TaxID=186817 RepID=UPI0020D10D2F|nr:Ger(x)C family spore germination protein [Alkalihalobacillus sp. LMS6]UTR05852.1 Ger(x)C family spore germination protein [Alkalihalobacillus sp. LMS6]